MGPPPHHEWGEAVQLVNMHMVASQSCLNLHSVIYAYVHEDYPQVICLVHFLIEDNPDRAAVLQRRRFTAVVRTVFCSRALLPPALLTSSLHNRIGRTVDQLGHACSGTELCA